MAKYPEGFGTIKNKAGDMFRFVGGKFSKINPAIPKAPTGLQIGGNKKGSLGSMGKGIMKGAMMGGVAQPRKKKRLNANSLLTGAVGMAKTFMGGRGK
jgi:hypothetical protein